MTLSVVLWKWKRQSNWSQNYNIQHVNAACRMIRAHLHMPHRIVLITDTPEEKPECETIPLWDNPVIDMGRGHPNCYKRLYAFSKDMRPLLGERFVSMDLDCVIFPGPDGKGITPLLNRPENDFMIVNGYRGDKGCCPYNGSMWMMNTGCRSQVWKDFDPATSPFAHKELRMPNKARWYGSDQCWIAHKIPGEKTWCFKDGVMSYVRDGRRGGRTDPNCRVMFFAGHMKPWSKALARTAPSLWKEYRKYL